jgi:hypothetical protein
MQHSALIVRRLSTEITSETLWLTLGKITLRVVLDYTGSIFPRIEYTAGRKYLFFLAQIPICQKLLAFGFIKPSILHHCTSQQPKQSDGPQKSSN